MKKLILSITIFIFTSSPVLAEYNFVENSGLKEAADKDKGAGFDTVNAKSLPEAIGLYIGYFLSFLGVVFLILMIYGGYLWMTAAGDEKKVETAKSIIKNSIIGLIIIFSAYAITIFISQTDIWAKK